jgi:preprotein translocase subunit YajC
MSLNIGDNVCTRSGRKGIILSISDDKVSALVQLAADSHGPVMVSGITADLTRIETDPPACRV